MKPLLEDFYAQAPKSGRVGFDPVQFPRRYSDPRDVEVAGLIAASLAYGRVDLFAPKIEQVLQGLGPSPAQFLRDARPKALAPFLSGFVYRFNLAADVGVLLLGIGRVLREWGSLEARFVEALRVEGSLHAALGAWTASLRDVPVKPVEKVLGPTRGLAHLVPSPLGPGAAKRLNMYLRWMVRGPDEVDLGIWRDVSPSVLVIPLDTHIARIAKRLGLTRRTDLGWKTAEEITESLRQVDPTDPVRFDFALCHHGMSGICAPQVTEKACATCKLRPACRTGRRGLSP